VSVNDGLIVVAVVALLVFPVRGLWKLARTAPHRGWRTPAWFGRAAAVSAYVMVLAWLRGLSSNGPPMNKTCRIFHQQPFDQDYYEAHLDEWRRLFPLSNKCNPHYDLVPAWVNPTVAVSFVLLLVSIAGVLLTTYSARRTSSQKVGTS